MFLWFATKRCSCVCLLMMKFSDIDIDMCGHFLFLSLSINFLPFRVNNMFAAEWRERPLVNLNLTRIQSSKALRKETKYYILIVVLIRQSRTSFLYRFFQYSILLLFRFTSIFIYFSKLIVFVCMNFSVSCLQVIGDFQWLKKYILKISFDSLKSFIMGFSFDKASEGVFLMMFILTDKNCYRLQFEFIDGP